MKAGLTKFVLAATLACESYGWHDSGHALVMAVAREALLREGRSDVIDLAETFLGVSARSYPEYSSFLRTGTWMDKIKSHISLFSMMHYKDIPFSSTGKETTLTLISESAGKAFVNNDTIIGAPLALSNSLKVLVDPNGKTLADDYASPWATDLALRMAFHVIGDLHNPLHVVGWWHEAFCKDAGTPQEWCDSDQGGNAVFVSDTEMEETLPEGTTNLHMLWDSMCAAYTDYIETVEDSFLVDTAQEFVSQYSLDYFQGKYEVNTYDAFEIMWESYILATTQHDKQVFADGTPKRLYAMELMDYDVNTPLPTLKLSDEYMGWCKAATVERVTLAGYRVAYLLKEFHRSTPEAAVQRAVDASYREGEACGAGALFVGAGWLAAVLTLFSSMF